MDELTFVEVKVNCSACGKELKIVKLESSDTSEFLCPRCSSGEYQFDGQE